MRRGATSARGQSLVVWAIHESRQCASAIDLSRMGATTLPQYGPMAVSAMINA